MLFKIVYFVFVLVPFMIVAIPAQMIIVKFNLKGWKVIPQLFLKLSCILFGLRIKIIGEPTTDRPTLMISNHIAWTDILAIGASAPVTFVAKRQVGEWPVVKTLANLMRTIYADRERRTSTGKTAEAMGKHMAGGSSLVLFGEGRSDVGTHVLPFRSALVGAAQMAMAEAGAINVLLQPVTIAYTRIQGLPISRAERSSIAWSKAQSVKQNVLNILGGSVKDVSIAFGQPIPLNPQTNRKSVTAAAEQIVRTNLVALNRGGELLV